MPVRLARATVVAALVLLMAVTPLSVVLSAGGFETWLPGWDGVSPTRVVLEDHTGLVKGISPAYPAQLHDGVTNLRGNGRVLFVQWLGGCDDPLTTLTLDRTDLGYRLLERTQHHCMFLVGIGRAVTITLWAPVDASTVLFESMN
jgi:hypothetical protein